MSHRLKGGIDMEALSPRDANAQRAPKMDPKMKTAAQLRANKEKDHPPPPPEQITEPPSSDRPDGAIYQVGKLLGKGGFAICYYGQLQSTKQRVALKIVKSKMPSKMEQKFQTELQIHSKMRHPNIVQFFRAFSFNNCTFLVLELCPNGSLMDMVKRRKGLTEAEVRFYAVQITGAIKYMHSKGIIHRDLKMGNIFLDHNMNAKIGDFGLAALMVTGRDMQTIRRTTLCGTPNYIAPEILEKGKKGHDHMVDIWSLGIIMYAMLTSKPPFQSSTTDEIYRKAKERDYEWPRHEATQKLISAEAKDFVAILLQDADARPDADEIVQHPFFTSGYLPDASEITPRLRELLPEKAEFYVSHMSSSMQARVDRNLKTMCSECGVGPWNETKIIHAQIWKEVAAEEKAGLTPMIPLDENIVYRPFDEWMREQREAQAQNQLQASLEKMSINSTTPTSDDSLAASQKPITGLLRAPPQSFAAQQRAMNRPSSTSAIARPRPQQDSGLTTSQSVRARPIPRTKENTNSTTETKATSREPTPMDTAPVSRPAMTTAVTTTTAPRRQMSGSSIRSQTKPPRAVVVETKEVSKPKETSSRTPVPSAPPSTATPSTVAPVLTPPSMDSAQTLELDSLVSLFGPSERPEFLTGTRPDVVLGRLQRLEAELDRALNSRTMAFVSSRTVTPSHPFIVTKWVDYTNKYGLGYMLNNGSIGCLVRDLPTMEAGQVAMCPSSCVLVRGADSHFQRRKDPNYADKHQPTPMNEDIQFFEYHGEDGLSSVTVSPQMFKISVNSDDTPGRMKPGRDVFEHRKRERVIVWKRFANYMAAKGRDESVVVEESSGTTKSENNAELVIFYQGFGDVRCWVFGDGHLQFNFPDHTKIVLDSTGTWCHFWHLPKETAEELARSGTIGDAALDKRSALTYPLQTLLNFHTKPTISRSQTTTTRRRPEIEPELQGVPAANDFRRKVEFIRNVVREWVSNEGLGNSDMTRASRLRWMGYREASPYGNHPEKHVWVTLGARWGDGRTAAYVDPSRPGELGPDIDESKKRTQAA